MLTDQFGRKFEYLRLSVTDVCNFRCNYCLPDGNDCDTDPNKLSLDEIRTLVHAFAGLGTKKIRVTGGEPGLRKDLTQIIETCAQTPGIEKVALTTNGFNLEQKAQEFVDAGLSSLNVSIDSLDPRMFHSITGHNKLEKVLAGLDAAIAAGIKQVKVNTVLMRQFNHSEFQLFLDWVKTADITLRFIELMQTGDNEDFFQQNHISGQSLKSRLLENGWTRIIRESTAGPAQEFTHEDHKGNIGLIMPYSKDFCASCNRLRVSSTGQLHLCLFASQGLDLRPYLRDGDVVATQQALVAMLQTKESQHQLAEGFTGATRHLAMLGG